MTTLFLFPILYPSNINPTGLLGSKKNLFVFVVPQKTELGSIFENIIPQNGIIWENMKYETVLLKFLPVRKMAGEEPNCF